MMQSVGTMIAKGLISGGSSESGDRMFCLARSVLVSKIHRIGHVTYVA